MARNRRIVLLIVLAALGTAAGYVGSRLTGHDAWYLAIPAAIALGWLVVAEPSQCAPLDGRNESSRPRR